MRDENEDNALDLLFYFHSFDKLDEAMVNKLSADHNVDCKELCERHGITYNVKEK